MTQPISRRELLVGGALALASRPRGLRAAAPVGRVTVGRCPTYGSELVPALDKMFDELGGLGRLVKGKTVAVKVNFIGNAWNRLGHHRVEDTFWTHPRMIGATAHLLGKAGARRVRIIEGGRSSSEPLEQFMMSVNWRPSDIRNAAPDVEFENTNFLGYGNKYSRLQVPFGGWVFPAYDLNHSYEDCDVFVSLAKLKEHNGTGITLSMKNVYGITPATIYGDGAGIDEPTLRPIGGRGSVCHAGRRGPSKSAPQELDPTTPRTTGYRIPRITTELCAARPVDLAIIDGIHSVTGGEVAPYYDRQYSARRRKMFPVKPGVLVAGTNCVATDGVAMAVMGFDPLAGPDQEPFRSVKSDSTPQLGEEAGLGIRDPGKNEVVGLPISEALFDFTAVRENLAGRLSGG